MSDKTINELLEDLDTSGLTLTVLGALDYIVPGEWTNITSFEQMIRVVTEEDDEEVIQQVGERAIELYADPENGYQRAVSLFSRVDSIDKVAGAAAMAAKVGEKFSFLGFLDALTPKADTTQALDAALKLAAELATFCLVNGMPGDSISDFVRSMSSYAKEDKMRMAAYLAIDCVLPLGPDFYVRMHDAVAGIDVGGLTSNGLFGVVAQYLPGGSDGDKKELIQQNLEASEGYLNDFVAENGIHQEGLMDRIKGFVEVSDSKLDYVAAFLDMGTNYYRHLGTQTVVRQVISRAYGEI